MSRLDDDPRFRASDEIEERSSGPGPARFLLVSLAVGVGILVALGLGNFRVNIGPWMLFFTLAGAVWWVLHVNLPTARQVPWRTPEPEQPPQRFAADMDTRRTVNLIDQAQPGKGFTSATLTRILADRTRARLVRRHGLPADDTLAHAAPHLSPQLLDYLAREGTDDTLSIAPRTLRTYLKEIEAL